MSCRRNANERERRAMRGYKKVVPLIYKNFWREASNKFLSAQFFKNPRERGEWGDNMSSVESIIADRTARKDMRMSGNLVMTKDEWLVRGGEYRGSVWNANENGYFTVRQCEKMGQSVSLEELDAARDFAMIKNHGGNYIKGPDGIRHCACVPVFYRVRK